MKLKQLLKLSLVKHQKQTTSVCQLYVSLNQNQLKQVTQKHKLKKKVQTTKLLNSPYAGNGRALSLDDTTGFVKLITLKEDDTVIGAQIAGNGASDIISELGLAIEAGMNAEDIALTVHAHPTLGEMSMEAAEKAIGMPIHTM